MLMQRNTFFTNVVPFYKKNSRIFYNPTVSYIHKVLKSLNTQIFANLFYFLIRYGVY